MNNRFCATYLISRGFGQSPQSKHESRTQLRRKENTRQPKSRQCPISEIQMLVAECEGRGTLMFHVEHHRILAEKLSRNHGDQIVRLETPGTSATLLAS